MGRTSETSWVDVCNWGSSQLWLQLRNRCRLWQWLLVIFLWCVLLINFGEAEPSLLVQEKLDTNVDKVSKLPQITRRLSHSNLQVPHDYVVGHVGRSLHASYGAIGTIVWQFCSLLNGVFHRLLLEECGFLINSCYWAWSPLGKWAKVCCS